MHFGEDAICWRDPQIGIHVDHPLRKKIALSPAAWLKSAVSLIYAYIVFKYTAAA